VTISHGNNTTVRLNSSSDASVRIYLQGNWTAIPMGLSFASAEGYDTSLQVHGQDLSKVLQKEKGWDINS